MTRWTGFGHDRLYVRGEDDEAVGWWDLLSDEGHPETADKAAWLADAVAEWRAIESASAVIEEPAGTAAPAVAVPEPQADDIDVDLESAECAGPLLPHYSTR